MKFFTDRLLKRNFLSTDIHFYQFSAFCQRKDKNRFSPKGSIPPSSRVSSTELFTRNRKN